MNSFDLIVVMPVYNEEEIIETVIDDWNEHLKKLHIKFLIHAYNDGSKDKTLSVLHILEKKYPHLKTTDKPNSGHGPTILKAYRDNTDADWIFQIDSDNEIQADNFQKFWEQRDNYDFLIGKRTSRSQPLSRRIVSSISRLTVRLFYSGKIYDVNSPFRLMRNERFQPLFHSIPADYFAPNVIISGLAGWKKLRTLEIPVIHVNRQTGSVSIKKWKLLKSALRSFRQTISYRFSRNGNF